MEHLMEMLDLVTAKFSDFADSNVVVGEPVKLDKVTIVPLIRVNVGFGGGGGQGEGDFAGPHKGKRKGPANCAAGKGIGGGAGAGGKARPVGVIVFDEDGVSVHAIPHKKGLLDKLFDRVPEVIELVKKAQDGKPSTAE
jgi:uncharacterized spore protein YtfJ